MSIPDEEVFIPINEDSSHIAKEFSKFKDEIICSMGVPKELLFGGGYSDQDKVIAYQNWANKILYEAMAKDDTK